MNLYYDYVRNLEILTTMTKTVTVLLLFPLHPFSPLNLFILPVGSCFYIIFSNKEYSWNVKYKDLGGTKRIENNATESLPRQRVLSTTLHRYRSLMPALEISSYPVG